MQLRQDVDPRASRHGQVEDDQGGLRPRRELECLVAVRGFVNIVEPGEGEHPTHEQALVVVVVDEDDPKGSGVRAHGSSIAGRARKNVAPRPGSDSTQSRPPWASASDLAMKSPSPLPGTPFVSRSRPNLANAAASSSGLIPGPWSSMLDEDLLPDPLEFDVNRRVGGAVLHRVRDEVAEDLPRAALVRQRLDRRRDGDAQVAVGCHVPRVRDDLVDDGGDIERVRIHVELPRVDAGHVEDVVDERRQGHRAMRHAAHEVQPLVVAHDVPIGRERLQQVLDQPHRTTQIVRDDGDEVGLHPVELAELRRCVTFAFEDCSQRVLGALALREVTSDLGEAAMDAVGPVRAR